MQGGGSHAARLWFSVDMTVLVVVGFIDSGVQRAIAVHPGLA